MKLYRLRAGVMIIWLCLAAGLVFAQDANVEPTNGTTLDYNRDRMQYEGANATDTLELMVAIAPQTVVYGEVGGEELMLDVYQPATSDTPRAAVIVIHGGLAIMGTSRSEVSDIAQGLAAAGYVAFNIDYRLMNATGNNKWPAQLDDAQLAVRWVRANATLYNVDPERVCALGHSFGGQLAALLGTRDTERDGDLTLASYSSRVACVIDMAGIADPTQPLLADWAQPAMVSLMGGTPDEVPELYHDASPLAQVDTDSAPLLLFHGAADDIVSVEESRNMVDALHNAGVAVVYVEYPHVDHIYWMNPDGWEHVSFETLAFLERHLATPAN
jgi:acetyl esterase/lipase